MTHDTSYIINDTSYRTHHTLAQPQQAMYIYVRRSDELLALHALPWRLLDNGSNRSTRNLCCPIRLLPHQKHQAKEPEGCIGVHRMSSLELAILVDVAQELVR